MELKRKTGVGILFARYNQNEDYPGFWIDLRKKGEGMHPVCNIEFNPDKQCVQVIVYADGNKEEPTHVIDIALADYIKG